MTQTASPVLPEVTVNRVATGAAGALLGMAFTGVESGRDLDTLFAVDTRNRTVLVGDVLGDLSAAPGFVPLATLATEYASAVTAEDVRAVVGHCTASALAILVSTALGGSTGAAPPVVLLDPVLPKEDRVRAGIAELRNGFGVARETAVDENVTRTENPGALLARLDAVLADDARAFAAATGLADDEAESVVGELVPRYRAWLGFLMAGWHADLPDMLPPISLVMSSERPVPHELVRPSIPEHRLDVPAAALPATPAVRDLVHDLTAFAFEGTDG
jgi:hypothetical protein